MKAKIMIVMILGLVFLASCSGGTGGQRNSFELQSSFNGGSDGLSIAFSDDNAPPDKVRDQSLQPFSVRLLVSNKGEFDVPENSAFITLTGFDPVLLGLDSTSKTIPQLNGFKKQGENTIPGREQFIIFDNLRYTVSVVSGSVPQTLFANVCYPYETKSFALVCINGDTVPALDDSSKVCDLEGDIEFANSGAPIQIENVKQYPFGQSSIQLQFDIVHTPTSTDANVYERGSIDSNCKINGASASSADALFKRDKITYTVASGISGLDCGGTGTNTDTVTLSNDRITVTCVQDTTGQSEFQKPVTITMKYDYLDRISKTIQIEHIQR